LAEKGLKLIFFGTSPFAVPILAGLVRSPHTVALVVTQPDRPQGRGHRLVSPPVKRAALDWGLPLWQPEKVGSPASLEHLANLAPDVLVTAAYGQILTRAVLNLPALAAINVHASLLPKYRGPDPIRRVLLDGQTTTGVTIMHMERRVDAGDIILQEEVAIAPDETYGTLQEKLAQLGARLLVEALGLLAMGKAPRRPQDEEQASYAPPITRQDEAIDWSGSAQKIAAQVRALHPEPGAYTRWQETEVKVWRARPWPPSPAVRLPAGEKTSANWLRPEDVISPGEIIAVEKGQGLVVACGEGSLLVEEVQPGGGKRMAALAFANGYRLKVGSRLG